MADDAVRLLDALGLVQAQAVEQAVAIRKIIGSPAYPIDEARVREVAGQSYDRSFDPTGAARQRLAIYASGDRTGATN